MADEADITADREEREAPMLIAASRKPVGPAATGHCLWCDDPLDGERRWCDGEHRDLWQRAQGRR